MSEGFRLFGFATGNYRSKCHECESEFTGDKRAIMCMECAARKAAAEIERLSAENHTIKNAACELDEQAEQLSNECERLTALLDEAREVLRPFASVGKNYMAWEACDKPDGPIAWSPTLTQIRAATAFLAKLENKNA